MSRNIPYLQRRGDRFGFRMAVPFELQNTIGRRELTKSLNTSNKEIAIQRSLFLASECKKLFYKLLDMKKKKAAGVPVDYSLEISFGKIGETKVTGSAEPHETDAFNAAISNVIATLGSRGLGDNSAADLSAAVATKKKTLFEVIDEFMAAYPQEKADMLRKHQTCLQALKNVVGDMPITHFKRGNVKEFFEILQKLPPRWSDIQKKAGLSLKEIAAQTHPVLIAKKTFDQTYKTSINQFLVWSRETYADDGFQEISITQIKYGGLRTKKEANQRPLKLSELKRIFEGEEMKSFAANPELLHQFWLPVIGLYTGARVNEICQLNPQADVLQDEQTGIWHFHFTESTAGADGVRKRIKNDQSERRVPIHSKVLSLGFLDYFRAMKDARHRLIFPAWKPSRSKASSQGEKWFREFLHEIGVRDETVGATIKGMHAFRHTLSNAAMNVGVDESHIVGHAGGATKVATGYRGTMALETKRETLEKIQFDLNIPRPTSSM